MIAHGVTPDAVMDVHNFIPGRGGFLGNPCREAHLSGVTVAVSSAAAQALIGVDVTVQGLAPVSGSAVGTGLLIVGRPLERLPLRVLHHGVWQAEGKGVGAEFVAGKSRGTIYAVPLAGADAALRAELSGAKSNAR